MNKEQLENKIGNLCHEAEVARVAGKDKEYRKFIEEISKLREVYEALNE